MEMDWVLCLRENQTFPQTPCVQKICDLVLTYLNLVVPLTYLLSLFVPICSGFVHGAEISAGRSPLMYEGLLWGKLGLLSLKPQVVAGNVLPKMRVLSGLFGSSVMGTVFCWVFT